MTTLTTTKVPTTSSTSSAGQAATALAYARAQIGKPYVWGGNGPDGFDCSGLTQQAYKAAGIDIPRTTATQVNAGVQVAKADLQPGDLVFPTLSHVQIYAGDGKIVEAPHKGTNIREVPMWDFVTARRVTTDGKTTDGKSALSTLTGAALGAANAVGDLVNGSAIGAVSDVLSGTTLRAIGLQLAFTVGGVVLVVLGVTRLTTGAAATVYDQVKEQVL